MRETVAEGNCRRGILGPSRYSRGWVRLRINWHYRQAYQVSTRFSMSPCFESILQMQLMQWIGESLSLMQMGPSRRDQCVLWIAETRFFDARLCG